MMTSHGEPLPEETRLSDEEFMRRLRARLVERGGEGADAVADAVDIGTWREGEFKNDPECAADEEIYYWTDDGDE